ncbi:MAG: helix-turn-helix transcriptional regulator [Nitriliruptoraceae bacterium]|nr:helix-turn-helix transcriptional regulator [Nitriliruptoraceae bacterium]
METLTARQLVARNVKRVRELRNRSQAQLARQLGWSPPTMWKLEHGDRDVSVDDLLSLALALNVAPAVLCSPWEDDESLSVQLEGQGLELQVDAVEAFGWIVGAPPADLIPLTGNPVEYFATTPASIQRRYGDRLLRELREHHGWTVSVDGRSVTRPSGMTVRWTGEH